MFFCQVIEVKQLLKGSNKRKKVSISKEETWAGWAVRFGSSGELFGCISLSSQAVQYFLPLCYFLFEERTEIFMHFCLSSGPLS